MAGSDGDQVVPEMASRSLPPNPSTADGQMQLTNVFRRVLPYDPLRQSSPINRCRISHSLSAFNLDTRPSNPVPQFSQSGNSGRNCTGVVGTGVVSNQRCQICQALNKQHDRTQYCDLPKEEISVDLTIY